MKLKWQKNQIKIKQDNYVSREWKEKNDLYLIELQRFFDIVDNIQDCELRQRLLGQMLICDNVLTEIAEKKFNDFYEKGYKKAKDG